MSSTTSVRIAAAPARVWHVITNPALVKQWFFGATVESDWRAGAPIVFRGQVQGQSYEHAGTITKIEPGKTVQYTYELPALHDAPEKHELVAFELLKDVYGTRLTVRVEGIPSLRARERSLVLWARALEELKKVAER